MREGWEMKKLGEISKIMYGYTAKSTFDFVGPKYLRITDIQNSKVDWDLVPNCNDLNGEYEKYRLKKGDIVFARTGATTGKSFLIQDLPSAVFASYLIRVQLNSKMIVPDFIYHFFQSSTYWKTIEKGITGSAQGGFNASKLSNLSIPIPPLSEQQYIVSILDKVFAAIDEAKANTEKNLNNAKELFQSQLNKIFSQKGEGWVGKKLGEIIEYDKTVNKKNDLPYVGLENIESNTGKFLGTFEPQQVKSSTFYFTAKHILYGRLRPYLNKVLLPDFEGHCSTEIFPILVSKEINKAFLYFWLMSGKTVERINATWTGARMPRANMNAVLDFTFSFPPLKEQQKVASQLNALSAGTKKLEERYQKKLEQLEDLKKSILEKAFKGELSEKELAV